MNPSETEYKVPNNNNTKPAWLHTGTLCMYAYLFVHLHVQAVGHLVILQAKQYNTINIAVQEEVQETTRLGIHSIVYVLRDTARNRAKGTQQLLPASIIIPQKLNRILSRSLEEPSLATTRQGIYFIFYIFSPLHVSALAGHLQVEYTIILGSYLTSPNNLDKAREEGCRTPK
jgi:hypothetical protein